MSELSMTEQRKTALLQVKASRVGYDPRAATWLVDGAAVSGWQGRTLSELRRAEYLTVRPVSNPDEPSIVELSKSGWEVVSS